LHANRFTLSTRHRAVLAPLAFALVIAVGTLVAPAGPAARPALAAAQPTAAQPAAAVASAADLSLAAAESSLVLMINADRAAAGLRPLRVDARLSAIASERSASMAAAGRLSHVQSDGRTMVDLIKANDITWYAAGETIGWNNYPSLRDSTSVVNRGWMNSVEHAAIIRSTAYNYLGVGLSLTARGTRYWTAIFLRGPDRTAPWAKMLAPTAGSNATLASRRRVILVTWSWTGDDRPLAALSSGLRSFEVQRRIDGGPWVSVWTSTTSRVWSSSVSVGHRVQIRVRARDRVGNVGAWSSPMSFSA
jgi:uncharacterized protein YkwD